MNSALLVTPVARHVLARVAEGVGTFDPNLFAFQRALEFLQRTDFVISAIDFPFAADSSNTLSSHAGVTTPSIGMDFASGKWRWWLPR
jgi:hypothetical protein